MSRLTTKNKSQNNNKQSHNRPKMGKFQFKKISKLEQVKERNFRSGAPLFLNTKDFPTIIQFTAYHRNLTHVSFREFM